ncbi:similar to Saccharomyces cerevisiae YKL119C VPH2 Integral membrane protein required for vacuolar H+-ATPase (V-ATPase) function, although not an actual component of the V-ATPase complex [Maudiozyma saulgeensis]|uniref:Similar to Saccharomyces cerevisiae YKL119C VPH2 Integral membrane protein required for vacuolar H+-ATPase (V-ATPase) function, although not an actual component of the V-ATPase complex n=1 Tax=Maudiozyma saulgeensis TaxID=1789683 RepID=A0A1X7QZP1_9SACH|nr:similar to Saccharomyces cerevisiae YKL119C VPH2 Integral membrane protein required for vacuolar H+-ATPase (V-ATPase) function, although not an actual component of the V-ATPase complex [Kazachstania saulgeensis]
MFEIKLNKCLKTELEKLSSEATITQQQNQSFSKDEISRYIKHDSIPMSSLLSIYNLYWKDNTGVTIKELLTPLSFKFKEKRKRGEGYSKEFKEQLEKLRLVQQENDYQRLVSREKETNSLVHVKEGDELDLSPAQINKQIKEQVTTIFNILLSVLSVIFAIWYWTGTSMRIDIPYRILLCLFFGILVLVAEVVVYNSYLNKIDDARKKERSKVEKKKVIKTL